jgi:phosphatidylserine/phosphatidylglycerophosphate/cardiolipin synthase-like enzyme
MDIDEILQQTLEDRRLSRGESQALREVLKEHAGDRRKIADVRTRAFRLARKRIRGKENDEVVDWLEEVVRVLFSVTNDNLKASHAEAVFSPGPDCVQRIAGLIRGARESVDVAVYTLTDDRIARALLDAHGDGTRVRIIADDEKFEDRGSDLARLRKAGIRVVTDRSDSHMHHKFALFDDALVMTGSFNWTRSATEENQENIVVSDDPRLVGAFRGEFEKLWGRFAK